MILVDTTVWIDFFRKGSRPWKPHLKNLLSRGEIAIVDPILAELLYGAKGEAERQLIQDLSKAVTLLSNTTEQWLKAGQLGSELRAKGLTLSMVDCFIASSAQTADIPLWTFDRDFEPLFTGRVVEGYSI